MDGWNGNGIANVMHRKEGNSLQNKERRICDSPVVK